MDKKLDEKIKERLEDNVKPSPEFELKVIRMVEKEKQRVKEENKSFSKVSKQEINENNAKNGHKGGMRFAKILSMAAVIILVFTLGMNFKNVQIIGDSGDANLISIKAIKPTNMESGILANNSEFIIQAEGENLNTEIIQRSVYVEPALEYTIEKTSNNNEYKLKFKQNIPDNTILKLQYVKDQIAEDSWAYQTSNKLSVTRHYPDESDVSKNSVIEVEFSYANVENFEKYVNISPKVDGKWKHIGNIWRFIPSSALKDKQEYKVVIKKGIKAGKETLNENYKFSFVVGDVDKGIYQTSINIDRIITITPEELAKISYSEREYRNNTEVGKIEISRFSSLNDFIDYVENDDLSKAIRLGDYQFKKFVDDEQNGYIELKSKLQKGYYVAKIKDPKGNEFFNCPIQVSDLSAYAMETERDVLVWVAKGNELASNINLGLDVNIDIKFLCSVFSKESCTSKIASSIVLASLSI